MPAQNLDELVDQFDEAISVVPKLIAKHTEIGATNALALVDLRLVQKGTGANGAPFKDYTPAWKKKKTEAGRYRGHVDFQFSGQMLASITTAFERGDVQRTIGKDRTTIAFVPRDEFTRKKVEGNNRRRPGFLNPSKEEMITVTEVANEGMGRDLLAIFK